MTRQHVVPGDRPRLSESTTRDHWFVSGPRMTESGFGALDHLEHYERVAVEVWRLIDWRAEEIWARGPSARGGGAR
ncbi:MAG: hypothetical protein AB1416_08460 [Actinomycetota bacterium]